MCSDGSQPKERGAGNGSDRVLVVDMEPHPEGPEGALRAESERLRVRAVPDPVEAPEWDDPCQSSTRGQDGGSTPLRVSGPLCRRRHPRKIE